MLCTIPSVCCTWLDSLSLFLTFSPSAHPLLPVHHKAVHAECWFCFWAFIIDFVEPHPLESLSGILEFYYLIMMCWQQFGSFPSWVPYLYFSLVFMTHLQSGKCLTKRVQCCSSSPVFQTSWNWSTAEESRCLGLSLKRQFSQDSYALSGKQWNCCLSCRSRRVISIEIIVTCSISFSNSS